MRRPVLSLLLAFIGTTVWAQSYEIYVSDAGNFNNGPWQIAKFDSDGGNPTLYTDENVAWPQDIYFIEEANQALVSNLNTGNIELYDLETGAYADVWASDIGGPTRMKMGADGLIYVLQWTGNGLVKRYQVDGTFVDDFTDTAVPNSIGMDWDSEGNLYVSSYNQGYVRKFDTNGVDQGLYVNSNLAGPTNIWFDENGELLVCDWNGGTVDRFDVNGDYVEAFITGLSQPEGVAFLPNGHILIGNGGTGAVKEFDADGNFIQDVIEAGSGGLLTPNAVVIRFLTTGLEEQSTSAMDLAVIRRGEAFYLKEAQSGIQVEVMDLNGRIIHQQKTEADGLLWRSDTVRAGNYIIQATWPDEIMRSARVNLIR